MSVTNDAVQEPPPALAIPRRRPSVVHEVQEEDVPNEPANRRFVPDTNLPSSKKPAKLDKHSPLTAQNMVPPDEKPSGKRLVPVNFWPPATQAMASEKPRPNRPSISDSLPPPPRSRSVVGRLPRVTSSDDQPRISRSQSVSPSARATRFSALLELPGYHHDPPPRSMSPVKPALKQPPSHSRSSSRELTSGDDDSLRVKKTQRVGFVDAPAIDISEDKPSHEESQANENELAEADGATVPETARSSSDDTTDAAWESLALANGVQQSQRLRDALGEDHYFDDVFQPRPNLPSFNVDGFGRGRERERERGEKRKSLGPIRVPSPSPSRREYNGVSEARQTRDYSPDSSILSDDLPESDVVAAKSAMPLPDGSPNRPPTPPVSHTLQAQKSQGPDSSGSSVPAIAVLPATPAVEPREEELVTTRTRPSPADAQPISESESDSDSGDSIYSDALESFDESSGSSTSATAGTAVDGFGSINAIVDTPTAPLKLEPKLNPEQQPEPRTGASTDSAHLSSHQRKPLGDDGTLFRVDDLPPPRSRLRPRPGESGSAVGPNQRTEPNKMQVPSPVSNDRVRMPLPSSKPDHQPSQPKPQLSTSLPYSLPLSSGNDSDSESSFQRERRQRRRRPRTAPAGSGLHPTNLAGPERFSLRRTMRSPAGPDGLRSDMRQGRFAPRLQASSTKAANVFNRLPPPMPMSMRQRPPQQLPQTLSSKRTPPRKLQRPQPLLSTSLQRRSSSADEHNRPDNADNHHRHRGRRRPFSFLAKVIPGANSDADSDIEELATVAIRAGSNAEGFEVGPEAPSGKVTETGAGTRPATTTAPAIAPPVTTTPAPSRSRVSDLNSDFNSDHENDDDAVFTPVRGIPRRHDMADGDSTDLDDSSGGDHPNPSDTVATDNGDGDRGNHDSTRNDPAGPTEDDRANDARSMGLGLRTFKLRRRQQDHDQVQSQNQSASTCTDENASTSLNPKRMLRMFAPSTPDTHGKDNEKAAAGHMASPTADLPPFTPGHALIDTVVTASDASNIPVSQTQTQAADTQTQTPSQALAGLFSPDAPFSSRRSFLGRFTRGGGGGGGADKSIGSNDSKLAVADTGRQTLNSAAVVTPPAQTENDTHHNDEKAIVNNTNNTDTNVHMNNVNINTNLPHTAPTMAPQSHHSAKYDQNHNSDEQRPWNARLRPRRARPPVAEIISMDIADYKLRPNSRPDRGRSLSRKRDGYRNDSVRGTTDAARMAFPLADEDNMTDATTTDASSSVAGEELPVPIAVPGPETPTGPDESGQKKRRLVPLLKRALRRGGEAR